MAAGSRRALKFADEMRLSDDADCNHKKMGRGGHTGRKPRRSAAAAEVRGRLATWRARSGARGREALPVAASGSDMYWNFIFPVPIDRTRWVKAVEIRPGDKRFVHHANILVDRLQNSRQRENEPGAGFEGMEIKIESETFDPDSHFLFWKPGTVPYVEPEGMALRLDKGTDLVLNVHLQPSGKPETIQPTIGLYFTDQPATKFPMLLQLENDASSIFQRDEKLCRER